MASTSTSGGGGKGNITSQLNMSLDEAHLILNVKKDDPMEIIQKVRSVVTAAAFSSSGAIKRHDQADF